MSLILIVDDVRALADQYAYDLSRLAGWRTRVAVSAREALDAVTWDPVDCMLLDLELPETDGFGVLRALQKQKLDVPVIVYTGTGNYDRCVQAMKLGAFGFIDKSEPMERVVQEVENALARSRLEREVQSLRRELGDDSALLGSSPAMKTLGASIERVAAIPSPVLITGESGSGKEIVARELHRLGANPRGPFVAVNCAALPDSLIESELFGHERGAFTGAAQLHRGAFERAAGGTLFLDEIGELPAAAQAKLLRVLEQGEVTRLGGERSVQVNARVVAATHRDLDSDVKVGRFREDLYYRINTHTVAVPPLLERASDIPELANHFLATLCARFGRRRKRLDRDALAALMQYQWRRNNVRELRNVIERMVIATDADVIPLEAVPAEIRGNQPAPARKRARTFSDLRFEAERQIIVAALDANEWNITQTAARLGLADHSSLLKIMRRLGIKRRR